MKIKYMRSYFKILSFWAFLLILFSLINMNIVNSEGMTSEVRDFDEGFVLNYIQKIYEISPSSLEKGYSGVLNEKDAFRINIKEKDYYVIVWNISEGVKIVFQNERQSDLGLNQTMIVDIDRDGDLDVKLTLESIEGSGEDRKVRIFIKKFFEKELVPLGDYFELFDVTVRLKDHVIYSSRNLGAFIVFENFGEGPSEIEIVYSIINEEGEEVYRGIDSKVVMTEDSVVKDFHFLELPLGKYVLRTEIFYGDNQTGDSEQGFEIIEKSTFSILKGFFIFILILISIFMLIIFFKKKVNLER